MIARLRGTVIERGGDGVVVECGGVGYDVTVPTSTLIALPEPGAEVTLRIFTHATENRLALYGFATTEERSIFDLLITVKNVGPSTACAILSGAPSPDALARTIAAGDVAGLTRLKGIGKKTADLLVVELREKCEYLLATWGATGHLPVPVASSRAPILDDVASALVNMGWRPAEADKVLARMAVPVGATVELLLREALRAMPR
jgi:Holliday junction DNA helicase RuvA